jgi:outer membrane protein insertion porin family/translocation and assembly module TamA
MSAARRRLCLLVIAVAVGASACREESDVQVTSLRFTGVEHVDENALTSVLRTRESSWIPWGRKRYLDRRILEEDLKRIEAFYRDRGFPDARVSSFNVSLNSAQDKASITVDVSEGEPIRVAAVELVGFGVLNDHDRRDLQESIEPREGEPLDKVAARAARERALNALRDAGYPYADVTVMEEDSGVRLQRLVFQATPGTLARFGEIKVVGPKSVSDRVILRQLTFEPGDPFSQRKMRESQRRIFGLELFQFANVEAVTNETPGAPEVPVRVTVAEGDQQRVSYGVGYGSEEHVRARIRWDHANFLGGARQAGVEGKWSSLDRGVRAAYVEPYFVAAPYSLSFQGQAWQTVAPLYSLDSLGGRVTLRRQTNAQNAWSISFGDEFQRSSVAPEALADLTLRNDLIALGLDPIDGEFTGRLSGIAFEINRDTTANVIDARSGYVLSGRVEQAGAWLPGSFNYWSTTSEVRHYVPIRRAAVIATRLGAGSIVSLSGLPTDVPFYKRFFLGGSSSLRGWGRFEVSPVTETGLTIGGETMFEGSTEVRFPLRGKLGAVAFVDFGNSWLESWNFNLNDLRYDVGPGLRYLTPVGPIRVDLGFQLNPIPNLQVNGEPEKRHWRLHFSVGQAF